MSFFGDIRITDASTGIRKKTEAAAAAAGGGAEEEELGPFELAYDNGVGTQNPDLPRELDRYFDFLRRRATELQMPPASPPPRPLPAASAAGGDTGQKPPAHENVARLPVITKPSVIREAERDELRRGASPAGAEEAEEEEVEAPPASPRSPDVLPERREMPIPFKHPDVVVPANRKTFLDWVEKVYAPFRLGPIKDDPRACSRRGGSFRAFPYQQVYREMLQSDSHLRGLLLQVGLGAGKTCMSIIVAEANLPKRNVVVMLPASLHGNYENSLMKCGNPLYELDAYWEAQTTADAREATALENLQGLPEGYIAKNGGRLWVNTAAATSNLSSLSSAELKEIVAQTRAVIHHSQQFIHQNGLRKAGLQKMIADAGGNLFSGKTVIIDEIHNLSRMVTGSSEIAKTLQTQLLEAENCRIVGLSGTPIINNPHELAVVVNIIAGYTKVWKWSVTGVHKEATEAASMKKLAEQLNNEPHVDTWEYVSNDKAIYVTRVPEGFERKGETYHHLGKVSSSREITKWLEGLKKGITKHGGVALGRRTLQNEKRLPDDHDAFVKQFVDPKTLELRNPVQLRRRLMGTIGFYNVKDPNVLPTLVNADDMIVRLPMTDRQLAHYVNMRNEERKEESRVKKNAKRQAAVDIAGEIGDVASSQRVFSRQACDFVFPDGVNRVLPRDLRKEVRLNMINKGDVIAEGEEGADLGRARRTMHRLGAGEEEAKGDDDEVGEEVGNEIVVAAEDEKTPGKPKDYDAAVRSMLAGLRNAADSGALSVDKLEGEHGLSPKYASIIRKIGETPGIAVVYSQFVSLEGLAAFCECLRGNGYAQLQVARDGEGIWRELMPEDARMREEYLAAPKYIKYTGEVDSEARKILLALQRGDIDEVPESIRATLGARTENRHGEIAKVMCISASGAEGLDLKQVRQVHIVEPQWNQVRMDQTIGRGVRVCSHAELPPEERTVEAQIYVMTITKEQMKANETIERFDKGVTTDEYILGIAERKRRLVGNLQAAMRESAVDCRLFRERHGGSVCLAIPHANKGHDNIAYDAAISRDLKDEDVQAEVVHKTKARGKIVPFKGGKKGFRPVGEVNIYDLDEYKAGRQIIMAKVQKFSNGEGYQPIGDENVQSLDGKHAVLGSFKMSESGTLEFVRA